MNSSESIDLDSVLSESGEPDMMVSPKVVKVSQNGFFASWFNTVDPNAPVRDDQYFWPSGSALEADNFDDAEFDAYLNNCTRKLEAVDDLQPLVLADMMSVTSDDSAVEMLSIASDASDWSKMPAVLPPLEILKEDVDDLIAVPMMRKISDWTEMPALLPPLPGKLEPAPLERELSDWSKMPAVLPPLNVNPAPMIPQYSTDWSEMPEPLVPLDLLRERSRPVARPSQTPEILAPAPLVAAVSEPLAQVYPRPAMRPFIPFGSNDGAIAAFECQNIVPSLHIASPTQQFSVPKNLPQISWDGDQDGSLEFEEPQWDYKESTTSPDQILDYEVHCDHGSLMPAQSSEATLLNENLDLGASNPETALVLYQPYNLAPNVQSSRKATDQFTTYTVGKYQVIISNIPCESISAPVKGANQMCYTNVFPYLAKDNLGKTHYGFHFESSFVDAF